MRNPSKTSFKVPFGGGCIDMGLFLPVCPKFYRKVTGHLRMLFSFHVIGCWMEGALGGCGDIMRATSSNFHCLIIFYFWFIIWKEIQERLVQPGKLKHRCRLFCFQRILHCIHSLISLQYFGTVQKIKSISWGELWFTFKLDYNMKTIHNECSIWGENNLYQMFDCYFVNFTRDMVDWNRR